MDYILLTIIIGSFIAGMVAFYKVAISYNDKKTLVMMRFKAIIQDGSIYYLSLEEQMQNTQSGSSAQNNNPIQISYPVPTRVYNNQTDPKQIIVDHYKLEENDLIELLIDRKKETIGPDDYVVIDKRF